MWLVWDWPAGLVLVACPGSGSISDWPRFACLPSDLPVPGWAADADLAHLNGLIRGLPNPWVVARHSNALE